MTCEGVVTLRPDLQSRRSVLKGSNPNMLSLLMVRLMVITQHSATETGLLIRSLVVWVCIPPRQHEWHSGP